MDLRSSVIKYIGTALLGTAATLQAYYSADLFCESREIRHVANRTYFSKTNEISIEGYREAQDSTDTLANGKYYNGLVHAGIAGLLASGALYIASQKED